MGATFLMSHPGPTWAIRGGENFRSKDRAPTNPKKAMLEWLKLCETISAAGGRILVMPPAAATPALTGMIYTANAGQLFKNGLEWQFLLSKMSVPHRGGEREHIQKFFAEAGMPTGEAQHTWEGQADVAALPGNRFLISWGVRSVRESVDEVRARLPAGARVLDVQLREPFFHGDTCINSLINPGGDQVLLAHEGALVNRTLPELRGFIGNYGEVLAVDADDALGYACNALCVNGTVIMPTGLSTGLRGTLIKRGFKIEELELNELFGKGGGGPRCLVNQLAGFVISDDAPSFGVQRERLVNLSESYPESAA
jgi:N-dimethylarginine dimethylaminohydrolase